MLGNFYDRNPQSKQRFGSSSQNLFNKYKDYFLAHVKGKLPEAGQSAPFWLIFIGFVLSFFGAIGGILISLFILLRGNKILFFGDRYYDGNTRKKASSMFLFSLLMAFVYYIFIMIFKSSE